MRVDSLEMLQTLFETWRKEKRYDHERIPDALMAQARKAVAAHGLPAVIRATRITRARLAGVKGAKTPCRAKSSRRIPRSAGALIPVSEIQVPGSLPAHSRLILPSPYPRPLAEVETGRGLKLRIFECTTDIAALLTTLMTGEGGSRL